MDIVITGPESSGKSTLAAWLSQRLGLPLQQEEARSYLGGQSGYLPSDLIRIQERQSQREMALADAPGAILDTDILTLMIWWREKYGPLPILFNDAWHRRSPRVYLLCRPDIPWEPDPLRENPLDRDRLFDLYQYEMRLRQVPYRIVQGDGEDRLLGALAGLTQLQGKREALP
ncbi:MAG TPA: hypothetical protein DCP57_06155 [Gammaproteobacteria bacterium]|nr:MAG: hypothetical protein CBC94_003055 [Gammaproteobacteria bacterium TMED134]RZO69826.1 MAG: hypothetical protein EVA67_09905 [OM182 bacterium]HAL42009.1 hypothetical protein [Gammaproteobacteria bacterium]HBK18109.1 hypothetical protein [Gammaproteobacteria bacterium]|tara:strand:- start:5637 stop:6155 length:519 start_codon:yes stop_codon:yes gene_type:complete